MIGTHGNRHTVEGSCLTFVQSYRQTGQDRTGFRTNDHEINAIFGLLYNVAQGRGERDCWHNWCLFLVIKIIVTCISAFPGFCFPFSPFCFPRLCPFFRLPFLPAVNVCNAMRSRFKLAFHLDYLHEIHPFSLFCVCGIVITFFMREILTHFSVVPTRPTGLASRGQSY